MIGKRRIERIAEEDMAAPLLAVAVADGTVTVGPVDADAAERLPPALVASAIERFTLTISNPAMRPLTTAERRSVPALARFDADYQVRSFVWPIMLHPADQPVPAVLRALVERLGDTPCRSVAGLAQTERLAAHDALANALTPAEREALTASMHWSL